MEQLISTLLLLLEHVTLIFAASHNDFPTYIFTCARKSMLVRLGRWSRGVEMKCSWWGGYSDSPHLTNTTSTPPITTTTTATTLPSLFKLWQFSRLSVHWTHTLQAVGYAPQAGYCALPCGPEARLCAQLLPMPHARLLLQCCLEVQNSRVM